MREWQSQSHVRWYCRYHVVWVPKYRKRAIRGGPHPLDRFSSQLRWNPVHDSSDLGLTGTGA